MSLSIVSPKTGKWIKVGGEAYNDLLKDKKYASKTKKLPKVERITKGSPKKKEIKKIRELPKAKPQKLSQTLISVPNTRVVQRQKLKILISNEREGRGSRTRGWGAAAPQRGRERQELKSKCGNECFLLPERNAFPVCASLRTNQGCAVDCRGIIAAKVRAGQWKYEDVKKAAGLLEAKYGCSARHYLR